jgi:hypothetical protein
MSKSRLVAKLRQNDEYPAIKKFLKQVGFDHEVHNPTGSGHPFITIRLPHGAILKHHINCTPSNAGGNVRAALAGLRRALRTAGYDL